MIDRLNHFKCSAVESGLLSNELVGLFPEFQHDRRDRNRTQWDDRRPRLLPFQEGNSR